MDNKIISSTDNTQLTQQLLTAEDPTEIKNIMNLVNLNIKKRDVIRSTTLSDLQDKVISQMAERVEKRPGEFSNKDLLDYLNSIQGILNKSNPQNDEVPTIAIQNNTNIQVDALSQFDTDAKNRIRDALKSVLAQQAVIDATIDTEPINNIMKED